MNTNPINNHKHITTPLTIAFIVTIIIFRKPNHQSIKPATNFNGIKALEYVDYQLSSGPRTPGSKSHERVIDWIQISLEENGWLTNIQVGEVMGKSVKNIIAKRGTGDLWIILGTHYDSRLRADNDKIPANRKLPVPGANDGASGVALLLELARVLPKDLPYEIWIVFFDAEDNGNIEGWEWILGSQFFVNGLENYPQKMVLVDMIGDKDLNIFMEKNSDPRLTLDIWDIAKDLNYSKYFIPRYKHSILDDHIPFVLAGVQAVNIIDFDYPYWHTIDDTRDKISAESLQVVGNTLLLWLESLQ